MKAKEYMQQAFFLDKKINSLIRQLNNLRDQATNTTQIMSDMPRNPSGETSKMESRVVDICDLRDEIMKQIGKLMELRKDMMDIVMAVPDPECQLILQERYFEMLTWGDIACDINRSIRSAQIMHAKALDEVQKILDRRT